MKKYISLILSLILGPAIAAIAFDCVILPNHLLSGGVGGVAILLNTVTGINIQVLLIALFLPIVIWSFIQLGHKQVITAATCYVLFTVMLGIIPNFVPVYKTDPIVAALVSGVLLGISGGIVLRLGVANGPEALIGIFLKNKYNLQIGTFLTVFNIGIIATSLINSDPTLAVYSLVSIYIAGKVTDYLIVGFNRYFEVNIISDEYIDITQFIQKKLSRGVTYTQCLGTYSLKKKMLMTTLVSSVELMQLKEYAHSVDKECFIYINESTEVIGKRFLN